MYFGTFCMQLIIRSETSLYAVCLFVSQKKDSLGTIRLLGRGSWMSSEESWLDSVPILKPDQDGETTNF